MDISIYLILIVTGFFIGIISAMVGIGGGLITVPVLIFFFGLDQPVASAISTIVIVFTSSAGAFTYFKQKRIDLRTGVFFALIIIPSAFMGGIIADNLDKDVLLLIFGILLILVALRKIMSEVNKNRLKNSNSKLNSEIEIPYEETNLNYSLFPQSKEVRRIIDDKGEKFYYTVNLHRSLIGALVGGFIGGLLGVGGGVIFVPVLTSVGNLPAHIGVATSTFAIVFSSLSASIARILGPNVLYDYVIALAFGTVIGARLGALKVRKISSKNLLLIFYFIVIIAGIRAIIQALEALSVFTL
jgi:uncharacterized membrane protein YfcA